MREIHTIIKHVKRQLKNFVNKDKLVTLVILFIAIVIRINILFIPFIGRHGWNESLYASIVDDFIRNNRKYPYLVQYIRPDFNLGALPYYFAALFVKLFGNYEFCYRLPIFISSIINLFLVYLISNHIFNNKNRTISHLAMLLYATIPMTTYYGVRFQFEELTYMFYLLAMLYLIKYILYKSVKYISLSSFFLGFSVFLVKQTFMIYFPLLILFILMISKKSNKQISIKEKSKYFLISILLFLLPFFVQILLLAMLAPPNLNPIKFYLARIIFGPLSRLIYYKKIYGPSLSTSKILMSIELAYGQYFILFIFCIFGLIFTLRHFIIHETSIRLFLYFNLSIGLVGLYIMRAHLQNHEYYLYFIVLPVTILSSVGIYQLPKFLVDYFSKKNKIHYRRRKMCKNVLLTFFLFIIIGSFLGSYQIYWSLQDGFANQQAIKVGKYIESITNPNDIIIVQSPVIGFYSKRPNLHWGYLWVPGPGLEEPLNMFDYLKEYKPLLEAYSLYDQNVNAEKIAYIIEYWQPKVIVISPDVSSIFQERRSQLLPIIAYLTLLYKKNMIIKPYTIMTKDAKSVFNAENYSIYITLNSKYRTFIVMFKGLPLFLIKVFFDDSLQTGISNIHTPVYNFTSSNKKDYLIKCANGSVLFEYYNNFFSINITTITNFTKVIINYIPVYLNAMNVEIDYYNRDILFKMPFMNTTVNIGIKTLGEYQILQNQNGLIVKHQGNTLNFSISVEKGDI
ncbi:MAG: glycosyltransferase family 39 protein [Candidatus Asgardarchaeia archaeon]